MTRIYVMRGASYTQVKNRTGRPPYCMVCKKSIEIGQSYKKKTATHHVRRFHLDCWKKVKCWFCGKRIDMEKNGHKREGYHCHHINENHHDERPENLANCHNRCHNKYNRSKPISEQSEEVQRAFKKYLKAGAEALSTPISQQSKKRQEAFKKFQETGQKVAAKVHCLPISQQSIASQEAFKKFQETGHEATRRKVKYLCKLCKTPVKYGQRTKHLREKHPELGKVKSKDYFVLNKGEMA